MPVCGRYGRVRLVVSIRASITCPLGWRKHCRRARSTTWASGNRHGVEGSASYFINPGPGPDERSGYGEATVDGNTGKCTEAHCGGSGTGFQIEGGFAGNIWGPVGYRLHVRYTPFTDHYFGVGNKWTYKYPDGTEYTGTKEGAAFESYVTLIWGITASF